MRDLNPMYKFRRFLYLVYSLLFFIYFLFLLCVIVLMYFTHIELCHNKFYKIQRSKTAANLFKSIYLNLFKFFLQFILCKIV